ncbi:hypothetical protein D9M72_105800 [compost metagenome]
MIEPGFILATVSARIKRGASRPGKSAVVITMSALETALSTIAAWSLMYCSPGIHP